MALVLWGAIFIIFIPQSFGIICYFCRHETDLSKCSSLTECPNTEICAGSNIPDGRGGYLYTYGCIPKSVCESYVFGRRSVHLFDCCSNNYCNKNLFTTTTTSPPTATTGLTTTTLTTTTTSTTTTPASSTPLLPISCHLCRGPKMICERAHAPQLCGRPEQQFCINDVENLQDGSRYVTRRCATEAECEKDWIAETADRNECKLYNIDNLQAAHFSCAFCCKGANCNVDTVPAHLYMN